MDCGTIGNWFRGEQRFSFVDETAAVAAAAVDFLSPPDPRGTSKQLTSLLPFHCASTAALRAVNS